MTGYGLPGLPLTFGMLVGGGAAGEVAKLQADLDAATATIARLESELATAKELEGKLATANGTIATLTNDLAAANAEVTRLQGQVDSLTKQLAAVDDLKAELAKATDAAKTLSDQLEAANLTIASFVRKLATGRSDANVAEATRIAAEQQVARAVTKYGANDPRVRHAKKDLKEGIEALDKGNFQRAVKNFVDAYETAARLRKS
jgi:chromosome segregation ATPase